jgi:hypothetical protein
MTTHAIATVAMRSLCMRALFKKVKRQRNVQTSTIVHFLSTKIAVVSMLPVSDVGLARISSMTTRATVGRVMK